MQPHDTIGYWLSYALRCVGSAFFEILEAHCVEHGKTYVITPPQWGIMAVLSTHNGQTISTLGQQLAVETPAITGIVTRLEQHGLVERVHDRDDRRVVKVFLTAEGQDIIGSLQPVVAAFNERVLPHGQRQVLFEQLQHLIATVSTVAPDARGRFGSLSEYLRQREHEHGCS